MELVANKESYGFQGKHFKKGDIIEVANGEKFPLAHFDRVDGKPHEVEVEIEPKKFEPKKKEVK